MYITRGAEIAVKFVIRLGIILMFLPFKWDSGTNSVRKSSGLRRLMFNAFSGIVVSVWLKILIRFLLAVGRGPTEIGGPIVVTNSIWIMATTITTISVVQLHLNRDGLMYTINTTLGFSFGGSPEDADYLQPIPEIQRKSRDISIWTSNYLILGTLVFIPNPAVHALVLIAAPCSPQFVASLVLKCTSIRDNSPDLQAKLPFFFLETGLVTAVLYQFIFNWTIVLLGTSWMRQELLKLRFSIEMQLCQPFRLEDSSQSLHFKTYRRIQVVNACLNDSFEFYMTWFHSALLGLSGILLFATIRYTDVSIIMYIMFPLCAVRCVLEVMAILKLTGFANEESCWVLKEWGKLVAAQWKAQGQNMNGNVELGTIEIKRLCKEGQILQKYLVSCEEVKCRAGSFYTYTNKIVIISMCNLVVITLNLLILTK